MSSIHSTQNARNVPLAFRHLSSSAPFRRVRGNNNHNGKKNATSKIELTGEIFKNKTNESFRVVLLCVSCTVGLTAIRLATATLQHTHTHTHQARVRDGGRGTSRVCVDLDLGSVTFYLSFYWIEFSFILLPIVRTIAAFNYVNLNSCTWVWAKAHSHSRRRTHTHHQHIQRYGVDCVASKEEFHLPFFFGSSFFHWQFSFDFFIVTNETRCV